MSVTSQRSAGRVSHGWTGNREITFCKLSCCSLSSSSSSCCCCWVPLPSKRRRLSCDVYLEDKSEYYQNCSVLHCVPQLYTDISMHTHMSSSYRCAIYYMTASAKFSLGFCVCVCVCFFVCFTYLRPFVFFVFLVYFLMFDCVVNLSVLV